MSVDGSEVVNGRTGRIWIGIFGLMLLGGIAMNYLEHGSPSAMAYPSIWWEGAVGTAIGVALLPLIVGAFTRFRKPDVVAIVWVICIFSSVYFVVTNKPKTQSTTASEVVQRADWNAISVRFGQWHPALGNGEDRMIMMENIDRYGADPSLSSQDVLEKAYVASKADPRWVDVQ